jgi:hypothetical protein
VGLLCKKTKKMTNTLTTLKSARSLRLDPDVQSKQTKNPQIELTHQAKHVLLNFLPVPGLVNYVIDYLMVQMAWMCRRLWHSMADDGRIKCWWFNVTDSTFHGFFESDPRIPKEKFMRTASTMISMHNAQQPLILYFNTDVTEMFVLFPLLNKSCLAQVPELYQRGCGFDGSFMVNHTSPNLLYIAGLFIKEYTLGIQIDSFDVITGIWEPVVESFFSIDWTFAEFDPIGYRLIFVHITLHSILFHIYDLTTKTWMLQTQSLTMTSGGVHKLWKHYLIYFEPSWYYSKNNDRVMLLDLMQPTLRFRPIGFLERNKWQKFGDAVVLDHRLFIYGSVDNTHSALIELCEKGDTFEWKSQPNMTMIPKEVAIRASLKNKYTTACAIRKLDLLL